MNKSGIDEIDEILWRYSQIDGAHHKAWCLDQIARALYGDGYDDFVKEYCNDGEYN